MRRRRLTWLAAIVVVSVALFTFWPRGPQEPVHKGKTLSEWVLEIYDYQATENDSARQRTEAALQAVKSMGTNALPWLLAEFDRPVSRWRQSFNRWATKHPSIKFRFRKHVYPGSRFAVQVFHMLGQDTKPALPRLASCLGDERLGDAAARAMLACGETALPYFTNALASTNRAAMSAGLLGLALLARNSETAIPPMIRAMQLEDIGLRLEAVNGLAWTSVRPEVVIPALVQALQDPAPEVREEATEGLVRQSAFSHHAMRDLLVLKTNANPATALAASNTLYRLSMKAVEQPPITRCKPGANSFLISSPPTGN